MSASVKSTEIARYINNHQEILSDFLSVEEPLEIQIVYGEDFARKRVPLSVTMRTPGNDKELALGFLLTEGIIEKMDQVIDVETSHDNIVVIQLKPDVAVKQQSLSRNFYTTSSCGVCGKASVDAIYMGGSISENSFSVSTEILGTLPGKLGASQHNFQSTGGTHASALFDDKGSLLAVREDVGRHNALDKLIGTMLLANKLPLSKSILLVSGRASFELIQKACVAGIPLVAAVGAPSSLAVELAEDKGMTLIGFLKKDRFNIYSRPNRIRD